MTISQITTYATLQSAAAAMLHRESDTSITNNLPFFIQLAEGELFDKALLRESEVESDLTLTTSVNYVALPSTYVSPIALWLVVNSQRVLMRPALPQELPYSTTNAQPTYYAIDGANVRFDCPSDSGYTAKFRYMATDRLSVSNTDNELLLRRPDVYLYGTLKQVCLYTRDDEGVQKYSALYERALAAARSAETRARSSVPLRTDLPSSNSGYDITKG